MMWSKDELHRIAEVADLHVAPFREDSVTFGTPTWIWSVVVDGKFLRPCLQRAELPLVSSRVAPEGGPDHNRRHDEGRGFRTDQ
jgi:hypothetical protein